MKNQFIDYTTAKKLEELGFKEKCFNFYEFGTKEHWDYFKPTNPVTSLRAPLWQQVEAWLWDNYKISVLVAWHKGVIHKPSDFTVVGLSSNSQSLIGVISQTFGSPITAKIEGIKKVIKNLHTNFKRTQK